MTNAWKREGMFFVKRKHVVKYPFGWVVTRKIPVPLYYLIKKIKPELLGDKNENSN